MAGQPGCRGSARVGPRCHLGSPGSELGTVRELHLPRLTLQQPCEVGGITVSILQGRGGGSGAQGHPFLPDDRALSRPCPDMLWPPLHSAPSRKAAILFSCLGVRFLTWGPRVPGWASGR